jgi:hypothetical protein
VFVPNLVDRFCLVPTRIQLVREVEDGGVFGANVAIGMDDAGRDDHERGVRGADAVGLMTLGVSGPILPKVKFVVAEDKRKSVGLVDMLVGAACDAGVSDANVAHARQEAIRKFVLAEKLAQPAAGITINLKRLKPNAGDLGHFSSSGKEPTISFTR